MNGCVTGGSVPKHTTENAAVKTENAGQAKVLKDMIYCKTIEC